MDPIYLLKRINALPESGTVLDVGTRDGAISSRLVEMGMVVDAIDKNAIDPKVEGVNFETISVEDYLIKNDKKYDLVLARHVMHQLDNPKKVIEDLNKITDVFFFTCFGPKDDWAERVSILSHDEVMSMFKVESVKHHSETFEFAKTYAGDTKFWHINTFVIDNRI
jgi:hypothetical protein